MSNCLSCHCFQFPENSHSLTDSHSFNPYWSHWRIGNFSLRDYLGSRDLCSSLSLTSVGFLLIVALKEVVTWIWITCPLHKWLSNHVWCSCSLLMFEEEANACYLWWTLMPWSMHFPFCNVRQSCFCCVHPWSLYLFYFFFLAIFFFITYAHVTQIFSFGLFRLILYQSGIWFECCRSLMLCPELQGSSFPWLSWLQRLVLLVKVSTGKFYDVSNRCDALFA